MSSHPPTRDRELTPLPRHWLAKRALWVGPVILSLGWIAAWILVQQFAPSPPPRQTCIAIDHYCGAPPTQLLLTYGLTVTALTTIAIAVALWRRLRFGRSVILFTSLACAGMAAVKFVLSPPAMYRVDFSSSIAGPGASTVWIGGVVFAAYAAPVALMLRATRARVKAVLSSQISSHRSLAARFPVIILAGVFIFATSLVVLWAVANVVFVDSKSGGTSWRYLGTLIGGGAGLGIGVALAGAVTMCSAAFYTVGRRAIALRDAALVTAFFWFAMSLLAAYHVLWVVYILVLTSIWPLRYVAPK